MLISDRIYGQSEVREPVLLELIESPSVQRLKGINQLGVPEEFYFLKGFSRYEHCVGVMLLLRKLGAGVEEQVAGLLHDVSHTAFSHVIDWVIRGSGGKEDYQDENHLTVLEKTEIPKILTNHGFTTQGIADYHRFGLLEQEAPELCADRIDYALREFPDDTIAKCLEGLMVRDSRIIFKDVASARLFSENYLLRQKNNWGSLESYNRYHYFAIAMRRAMDLGLVKFEDFQKDDAHVMGLVENCEDPQIKKIFVALRKKSWEDFPRTGEMMPKKIRYIDPLCVTEKGLMHLSEADEGYKKLLDSELETQSKGIPLVSIG